VEKEMVAELERTDGVYIMRVAAMLTGMHPQTLRKYERAGLLEPQRSKKLRMYSDEDIARLRTIKHLVDDIGLNLAGVKVALKVQDTILKIRKQLASAELNPGRRKQLLKSLDESLDTLGTALGDDVEDYIYASGSGGSK
jgi:MerR family transcriptional regulator, heat shock protein HspR